MKYRADILALYGDLFEEAYASIEKQAGIFGRAGDAIKSRLAARAVAPGAVGKALDRGAQTEASTKVLEALRAHPQAGHLFANATPEMIARQYPHLVNPQVAAMRQARLPLGATPPPPSPPVPTGAAATEVAGEAATQGGKGMGAGTLAAIGIPAAGLGGYMLGRPNEAAQEQQRQRTRNIAFGAGTATGLAAPYVIRGIGSLANSIGGQGLYPGMMPEMGY